MILIAAIQSRDSRIFIPAQSRFQNLISEFKIDAKLHQSQIRPLYLSLWRPFQTLKALALTNPYCVYCVWCHANIYLELHHASVWSWNFEFLIDVITLAAGHLLNIMDALTPAQLDNISRVYSRNASLMRKTHEILKQTMITMENDNRKRLWQHPSADLGLIFSASKGILEQVDEGNVFAHSWYFIWRQSQNLCPTRCLEDGTAELSKLNLISVMLAK